MNEYLDRLRELAFSAEGKKGSLLHIGCGNGEFCRLAAEAGFQSVYGVDPDLLAIEEAINRTRPHSGSTIEFTAAFLEDLEFSRRRYDTVVVGDLLDHVFEPFHCVRIIMALARKRLIVEFKLKDPSAFGSLNFPFKSHKRTSIGFGLSKNAAIDPLKSTFRPTEDAMRQIFNRQCLSFEPVSFHASGKPGNRLLVAQRRNIKRMMVVAGPNSSGKSTFALLCRRGEQKLDAPMIKDTPIIDASKLHRKIGKVESLIYHYDFTRVLDNHLLSIARDPAARFIEEGEQSYIYTLMPSQRQLQQQFESVPESGPTNKRRKLLREIYYERADILKRYYMQWFKYLETLEYKVAASQIVMRSEDGEYKMVSSQEWHVFFEKQFPAR